VAAREQDEDEALDTALRVMRKGDGRTPPGTMAKAGRALRRRGYHQGSTAERLARMAGQGRGWRPAS
jgi:SOS response regulatory protein OraA/RecX